MATGDLRVIRPVAKQFPISSPYGIEREITIKGEKIKRIHKGIDFKVPERMPIYAMASGQIYRVGYENSNDPDQGYGYRIIQEGKVGKEHYFFYYCHLSWSIVHEGYHVIAGEYIACSGNTGRSTGPHLHVSARKKDTGDYLNLDFVNIEDIRPTGTNGYKEGNSLI